MILVANVREAVTMQGVVMATLERFGAVHFAVNSAAAAEPKNGKTSSASTTRPLPSVVKAYLTRPQGTEPATAVDLFDETATITDSGSTYSGRAQQLTFLESSSTEFTYTSKTVGAKRDGPIVTVTNWLEGDVPGGTVTLQYRFELSTDTTIHRLSIDT